MRAAGTVGAELARNADAHAAIRIEARDKSGAPLTGLAMSARLMRPIDSRADRVFALTEREAGIYRGAAVDVPRRPMESGDRGRPRRIAAVPVAQPRGAEVIMA